MKYKTIGIISAALLLVFMMAGSAFADGISSSGKDGAGTGLGGSSDSVSLDRVHPSFSDNGISTGAVGSLQISPEAEHILTWTSTTMRFRAENSENTSSQDPAGVSEVSSFLLLTAGVIPLALFRRRTIEA